MELVKKNFIIFVLFLTAFFLFFNLTEGGMYGDDAVYATRSIGMLDFMFSDKQPTLLQLLDKLPWWARLSNHDHPPLIFWLQHFFLIFHQSIFLAKLSSVFFGLLTVFIVYWWIKKDIDSKTALTASLLLAVNPYFIWFSKVTYLEAGEIFFATLALAAFSCFLKNKKYWFYFGLSLGLVLLTKYTAIFVWGIVFGYLLSKERKIFKEKRLYLSFLVVLVVVSPVIIYNIAMYRELGHFDLQISGFLKQNSPWSLDRNLTHSYIENFINIFRIFGGVMSWVYLSVFIVGSVYFVFYFGKRFNKRSQTLFQKEIILKTKNYPLIFSFWSIFFLFGLFIFVIPPEIRFLALFSPFLAIVIANFLNKLPAKMFFVITFIFVFYQLLFTFNSSVLFQPKGWENITYGAIRNQDYGISQLDKFLDDLLKDKKVVNRVDFYRKLKRKSSAFQKYKLENSFAYKNGEEFYPIFVWDPNINWFSGVWLFERRRFYENLPFFNASEFLKLLKTQKGIGEFYFIKVTENGPLVPEKYRQDFSYKFEEQLKKEGAEVINIYRQDKKTAFKIYKK